VTVGDVAGASGLKVADVEEGLRALAADTQATLQVSNAGEVVYVFKTDPRAALLARSWLLRVEPALNWAKVRSHTWTAVTSLVTSSSPPAHINPRPPFLCAERGGVSAARDVWHHSHRVHRAGGHRHLRHPHELHVSAPVDSSTKRPRHLHMAVGCRRGGLSPA
jgi:hypothetical protein